MQIAIISAATSYALRVDLELGLVSSDTHIACSNFLHITSRILKSLGFPIPEVEFSLNFVFSEVL